MIPQWAYRLAIWWWDWRSSRVQQQAEQAQAAIGDHHLEMALARSEHKQLVDEEARLCAETEKAKADRDFYKTLLEGGAHLDEEDE